MSDDEVGTIGREMGMAMRVAMQVMSRLAEQMARSREQRMRDAQHRSEQATREYAERLKVERTAAETQLRGVSDKQWWDQAKPEAITDAYLQAKAWSPESEIAAQAAHKIRSEVHQRYGFDVDNDQAARDFLAYGRAYKDVAGTEQKRAAQDRVEAGAAMTAAESADRQAERAAAELEEAKTWAGENTPERFAVWEQTYGPEAGKDERSDAEKELVGDWQRSQPEPSTAVEEGNRVQGDDARGEAVKKYDSADRRTAFANSMHAAGVDSEAIAARMSADTAQGRPARDAVRNGPGKPPVARKGKPNKSQGRDRQHAGR